MYGMFLFGQYESPIEVEKIVYVGGSHEQPNKQKTPIIRAKLLRKKNESFNIIVKSVEEF